MQLAQFLCSLPMSNSRVDTYLKCPYAYKKTYILNERPETTDALRIGSIVHSVLETYTATDSQDLDELLIIAEGAITKDEISNGSLDESNKEKIRSMLINYYDNFNQHLKPIGVEVPWIMFIGPAMFRGVIDKITLISDNPLTIECRDYKSSKKAKTHEEMKRDHQMGLYTMAIKLMYPQAHIVCVLDYIKLNQEVKHTFTEDELNIIKLELLDAVKRIMDDKEFKPLSFKDKNVLISCNFCGHNSSCGVGKKQKKIWEAIEKKRINKKEKV